jgi:regulator of protease activity HflC (stomatin/prohibitin superfamily)
VDKIEFIYQNAQDFKPRLVSIAVDRLKAEFGKVNAAHVAEKRGELRDTIKAVLKRDAQALGVEVTDFQLTNLEYTKSFRSAVEQAASAKAMVETREQEKQQAIRQAERAKIDAEGKANAAREAAKGDADARLVIAQAEAKAIQLKGEAQATAMRAQANALSANPVLVEMKKAEQWNGVLPAAIYAGAPIPFMSGSEVMLR